MKQDFAPGVGKEHLSVLTDLLAPGEFAHDAQIDSQHEIAVYLAMLAVLDYSQRLAGQQRRFVIVRIVEERCVDDAGFFAAAPEIRRCGFIG